MSPRTKPRLVSYTVTDTAWRASLALRFQLSFYPRACSERTLVAAGSSGLVRRARRDLPSVSASRIRWWPSRNSNDSNWHAEVREGSAADRHLQAILHSSFDTGPMRRAVLP